MSGSGIEISPTLKKDEIHDHSGVSSPPNLTSTLPSGCSDHWDFDVEGLSAKHHNTQTLIRRRSSTVQPMCVKPATQYLRQEIGNSWTAVLIIACYFVSGLVDAVTYSVWSCFVSMQTGNTIFLAIRIANEPESHHPLNYVKSLASIGCCCLGALALNCLHKAPGGLSNPSSPVHRWTLVTAFIIQSGLWMAAAILAQARILSIVADGTTSSETVSDLGSNNLDLVGISPLAFEAAGQVCLSRVLLANELPTIVLSTAYHDLIGESFTMGKCWRHSKTWWEFAESQKKQIRRLTSILSLFARGLDGAFVSLSKAGLSGALWVAAGTKISICIAWCLLKKKVVSATVVTQPAEMK